MSDAAISNANSSQIYLGGSATFDETAGKHEPTFTMGEVQNLIDEAVAKAVTEAVKKLSAEGGMPKFVMSDVIELIKMFLEKMGQFAPSLPQQPTYPIDFGGVTFNGPKKDDTKLVAGPAPVAAPAPAPAQPQIVIVPTQPRLNDQGQVVNVVTEQTAAQYGVKPGVVNIGDTLTSTSSASSTASAAPHATTAAEPVVSRAVATSYAETASKQMAQDLYSNAMAAQGMVESGASNGGSGSAKKIAGKATAKSWLMAIAEALGSSLGLKAQQMLNSTNQIAELSKTGEDLTNKLKALQNTAGTSTPEDQAKVQTIQSEQTDNAHRFTLETSRLQGASQEFQMLQNAMSNTIKSLGESLGQLARKG